MELWHVYKNDSFKYNIKPSFLALVNNIFKQ